MLHVHKAPCSRVVGGEFPHAMGAVMEPEAMAFVWGGSLPHVPPRWASEAVRPVRIRVSVWE